MSDQTWPKGSPERRAIEAGIGRVPREYAIGPVTRAEKAEAELERVYREIGEAIKWIDLDLERNLAQGRGSVARNKLERLLEERG